MVWIILIEATHLFFFYLITNTEFYLLTKGASISSGHCTETDTGCDYININTKPRFTDQVVHAEQKSLDAATVVRVPAGAHRQIAPHQLRQELQGEALKTSLSTPVELKQLVTYWLQELRYKKQRELPV